MSAKESGPRFYIDLVTIDPGETPSQQGRKCVISVVIEDFAFQTHCRSLTCGYHKVIVVDRQDVDKMARTVLEDLGARWCSYIKSSVGGCPKEKLEPALN